MEEDTREEALVGSIIKSNNEEFGEAKYHCQKNLGGLVQST